MHLKSSSTDRNCIYLSRDTRLLWPAIADRKRQDPLALAKHFVAILLLISLTITAHAADQKINKNWRSIAIKGYDPVAYFTMGEAVEGKSRHEYKWQDARWRFASEQHLGLFAANPEQYAPRFGGYCAQGMALGRTASIDPQAWLIVDDELYLNYSIEARDKMALHPEETTQKADRFWKKILLRLSER